MVRSVQNGGAGNTQRRNRSRWSGSCGQGQHRRAAEFGPTFSRHGASADVNFYKRKRSRAPGGSDGRACHPKISRAGLGGEVTMKSAAVKMRPGDKIRLSKIEIGDNARRCF